jgi:2-polyprenyl-3-methyl-5-hydroxy-6-metoxy-1,4-benzoquinol methylase
MSDSLDTEKLEHEVKSVYGDVAESAGADVHFETGRDLAIRLGYDPDDLGCVPDAAIDSFAGVGYYFDLAELESGADVLDLGSGSGMDAFVAGLHVTETGTVTGIDMTTEPVIETGRLNAYDGGTT